MSEHAVLVLAAMAVIAVVDIAALRFTGIFGLIVVGGSIPLAMKLMEKL